MRLLHSVSLMALAAMACLAPDTDAGAAEIQPATSAPTDGQIALTAHNNGDGTWSVKRGPTGPVLRNGLPREEALAIVGGATGPYEPANTQEAIAASKRAAIEREEADREAATANLSDAEVAATAPTDADASALVEENASLRSENEELKATVAQLRAQMVPFDGDNDGAPGGSASGMTKAQVIEKLTELKVEHDPSAKKADLVALLAAQPPEPASTDGAPGGDGSAAEPAPGSEHNGG